MGVISLDGAGVDAAVDSETAVDGTRAGFWTAGRVLALLVLAEVFIRTLSALAHPMVSADETAYLRMAENLVNGNGLLEVSGNTSTHFTPLLPVLIAAVSLLTRNYIIAGYIVVTIFGALALVPMYLLGKELFSERVGLMAAALLALMPIFISTTEYIYSEVLYVFFLLLSLFFGWRLLKGGGARNSVFCGLSLGLAYLSNPSAIFYLLVLLFLSVAVALQRSAWMRPGRAVGAQKGIWRRTAVAAALLTVTFLILALPYIVFMHRELGRWTFSGKSTEGNTYLATRNIRREDTKAMEEVLYSLNGENKEPLALTLQKHGDTPLSFMINYPVLAAKNFIRQLFALHQEVLVQFFPLWLLPLLGLGLFTNTWSTSRAAATGFLLLMMAPAILVLAMYSHARFFMPFVPFALFFVAAGWSRLEEWGRETSIAIFSGESGRRWATAMPWLIGAAVLLPLLAYSGVSLKKQTYETQYKEAGLWLKSQAGSGTRVLNRDFSSAYYADGTAVILPYADYAAMTAYARAQNVDYLVVGRQSLLNFRPQQKNLLEDGRQHPDWNLEHVVSPGTAKETLIFELVK